MALTKRLIAVSWTLPPIVLPRSIQIARTMKALRARGWTADIVTVTPEAIGGATLDPWLAEQYRSAYRALPIEIREEVKRSSLWRRLQRRFTPPRDLAQANWVDRATKTVVRHLGRKDGAVLVTFAQPWIDHAVGLAVQRARRVPWVAHFSDPWVDSPYYNGADPEQQERLAEWRVQERLVIEKADAIVFVTEETSELVMAKYDASLRRKVHVVPHGFDPELRIQSGTGPRQDAGLRLVYTGNIYAGMREPLALLEAAARLHADRSLEGRLEITFYGYAPPETIAHAEALGLARLVRFQGPVSYQKSLEALAAADALLLLDAPSQNSVFLPSKIVDYLLTGKPILGLTPRTGASAKVLSRCGHLIAPPDDLGAIDELLRTVLARWTEGTPVAPVNLSASADYDIRRTTSLFEGALDAALARGGR